MTGFYPVLSAALKILLIQFKRIGDLILTGPVLTVIQRHFPDVTIDLAVEKSSAGILPAFPAHTALVFTRGALNLGKLAAITRAKYDVCLDLNGSDRSLLLTVLSGAKRKITYRKIAKKFLRPHAYTDWVDSPLTKRHTVDHFLDILRPLGISEEGEAPLLQIPANKAAEAEHVLKSAGVTGPYVVVHPGTARAEKIWPPERWAEVARWLKEKHGLQVVITGVESDRAFAGMDQILSASGDACVSLIGKLSLLGTAAVIQKAKLLCSVDSSPIHMAEALHTPVVALFGPMNPYVWMPRHTPSRIIHPTVAHNEFSPETPSAKMSDISVEYVLRNISEILAG